MYICIQHTEMIKGIGIMSHKQTNLMKVLRSIVAFGSIAVEFLPCVNFLHCDMSFVSVTSH